MLIINCINRTQSAAKFVVFRKPPENIPALHSVIWKTLLVPPNPEYGFNMEVEMIYSFFSAKEAVVKYGAIISASDHLYGDTIRENDATLQDDFTLSNIRTGPEGGLTLHIPESIKPSSGAVGMAISGSPVYAADAVANETLFMPEVGEDLYAAVGSFSEGEVIDFYSLQFRSVQIRFSKYGVASVAINEDGTISS